MSLKQDEIYPNDIYTRYVNYFNNEDMDEWQIRQGITDLIGHALILEPKVIIAVLNACRRINDYALSVRFLKDVKGKCGSHVNEIYPYILQEIGPTLKELGINTPEELGFDKHE